MLAREFNTGTAAHNTRVVLMNSLCKIYDVIDKGGLFLSDDECDQLRKAADNFLTCYQSLSRIAMDAMKYKYSVVNKHHFLWHLVRQVPLNPKYVWCYQAEDYQRFVTRVGSASAVGTPINSVSVKIAERMRCGRHMKDFVSSARWHVWEWAP